MNLRRWKEQRQWTLLRSLTLSLCCDIRLHIKPRHNKVHRLDALDAYNQKLVKKIAVRGITVKGLSGTNAYLYLESIEVSKQMPIARIEIEVKQNSGIIKRIVRKLSKGDNLYDLSGGLDQYRGFVLSEINAQSRYS